MLKKNLLYPFHQELEAQMIASHGYLIPLYYRTGAIQEHLHCRTYASFFDISHLGQCLILGDNAASELAPLTTGKVSTLASWQQIHTLLTNESGGIIDEITITNTNLGLMLVVNALCKQKVFDYLKQNLSNDCEFIELNEQALFSVQGPKSAQIMRKLSPKTAQLKYKHACSTEICQIPCITSRSGFTGEDGFEISVSEQFAEPLARLLLVEALLKPAGLAARETLRIEAGYCAYDKELGETISPVSARMEWLLDSSRMDFPGAALIDSERKHGSEKVLVGLNVAGKTQVEEGSILYNEETQALGHVTSACFSPTLEKPIAMAYLNSHYAKPGTILMTQVQNRKVIVSVTELPFVPHRHFN